MRKGLRAKIAVTAGVGAVVLAAVIACQPRPIGAGTKIPISEKAYFVVPEGWVGRPDFGENRRYGFSIKEDKVAVGNGEFILYNAAAAPGFSELNKAAERKGIRTTEKMTSVNLARVTLKLTTYCYLTDPYYDEQYHRHVTPTWAFLGFAEGTCDGKWIAVGVRYDVPEEVVSREAASVPPALLASYEAKYLKLVTTSLHFE